MFSQMTPLSSSLAAALWDPPRRFSALLAKRSVIRSGPDALRVKVLLGGPLHSHEMATQTAGERGLSGQSHHLSCIPHFTSLKCRVGVWSTKPQLPVSFLPQPEL